MTRQMLTVLAVCLCGVPLYAQGILEPQAKAAVESFKVAYDSKVEEDRVAAVALLGDPAHTLTVKALTVLLTSDTEKVRIAAADVLAKFTGRTDVAPALAGALDVNEKLPDAEKAILKALGKTDDPAAAATLERFVKDVIPKRNREDLSDARIAVAALGELKRKAAVDALVDLLQRNAVSGSRGKDGQHHIRTEIAQACRKALRGLTGEKYDNWREWKDWWQEAAPKLDDRLSPR